MVNFLKALTHDPTSWVRLALYRVFLKNFVVILHVGDTSHYKVHYTRPFVIS